MIKLQIKGKANNRIRDKISKVEYGLKITRFFNDNDAMTKQESRLQY